MADILNFLDITFKIFAKILIMASSIDQQYKDHVLHLPEKLVIHHGKETT